MRRSWSDESLAEELTPICNALGRFPTKSELGDMGRNDLGCQISRRGGFVEIADRLGYPRKESDSDMGWLGENRCVSLLKSAEYEVDIPGGVKSPYDLLVGSLVRIDVKSAKWAKYGRSAGWFYRIAKHPQADIMALMRLDEGDVFFIPWWECPRTNITITKSGKYERFLNNYEVVDAMLADRRKQAEMFAET